MTAGPAKLPWWRRGWPGLATAAVLLLSKLKFLLLGLTKASTFVSMFAFFGVYWSIYGWPLALGLVFSIYIHEMGHVAMLSRCGIAASAPMFIPGIGALVQLKQRVEDPLTDAKIGLAGPMWGLGAAIVALVVYELSHAKIWLAIAQLTAFLNLFNLTPIWQLDGSRGVHVLARWERWALVAAIACHAAGDRAAPPVRRRSRRRLAIVSAGSRTRRHAHAGNVRDAGRRALVACTRRRLRLVLGVRRPPHPLALLAWPILRCRPPLAALFSAVRFRKSLHLVARVCSSAWACDVLRTTLQ